MLQSTWPIVPLLTTTTLFNSRRATRGGYRVDHQIIFIMLHSSMGFGRHKGLTMRITKRAVALGLLSSLFASIISGAFHVLDMMILDWGNIIYDFVRYHFDNTSIEFNAWWGHSIMSVAYNLPTSILACLIAFLVYSLMIIPDDDKQCRCRKCGYILKGISEPKCSECGEPI